jgi:hypothetical protein
VAPTYWLNPANGVSYNDRDADAAASPDSIRSHRSRTCRSRRSGGAAPQVLGGMATFTASESMPWSRQYDLQTMVQIYATTQDRDLGAVAADVRRIVAADGYAGRPSISLGKGAARSGEARWSRHFRACCSGCSGRSC